jgi:hypothetical protein
MVLPLTNPGQWTKSQATLYALTLFSVWNAIVRGV